MRMNSLFVSDYENNITNNEFAKTIFSDASCKTSVHSYKIFPGDANLRADKSGFIFVDIQWREPDCESLFLPSSNGSKLRFDGERYVVGICQLHTRFGPLALRHEGDGSGHHRLEALHHHLPAVVQFDRTFILDVESMNV